ncbi:hypothetical protein AXG93_4368s1240 [Marchantia polymorpha subsp. ruderalis]|uniref:Thiol-disulfide oxidoreductase DCC n=3 Tax=Marchantia polymorpha TaxID=3197 RepID=A0A176VXX5_MARPO|nr:hypothetical protein AXG93_4368s1240 [Marchantia polymorpha subsp. ruderalis]
MLQKVFDIKVAKAEFPEDDWLGCHFLSSLPETQASNLAVAMAMTVASVRGIPAMSSSKSVVIGPTASLVRGRDLSRLQMRNFQGHDFAVLKLPIRGSAVRGVRTSTGSSSSSSPLGDLKAKGDAYFATDTRPIILFDGVCNMCNGAVNFMLDNDAEGKVRFAALQSEAGRALLARSGRSPDDISSVVLVDQERAYIKSDAILNTLRYLQFPFPPVAMAASIVPLFLRDVVYDQVADNRYSVFGRTIACRLSDSRFEERFLSS